MTERDRRERGSYLMEGHILGDGTYPEVLKGPSHGAPFEWENKV